MLDLGFFLLYANVVAFLQNKGFKTLAKKGEGTKESPFYYPFILLISSKLAVLK
jgi:hypothetical protein